MNLSNVFKLIVLAIFLAGSTSSYAALYNRGNGLIYDSTLNITWLQDANYAKTSGYDADGRMTWLEAVTWADNLVYGGYTDWRLASSRLNGTGVVCYSSYATCPGYYNGAYDASYNNTHSELGHLYAELGNVSYFTPTGSFQPGWDELNQTFIDATDNVTPVSFLNSYNSYYTTVFWEAEIYAADPTQAWAFVYSGGGVNGVIPNNPSNNFAPLAWAVRDGDVVPVPAAAWFMGSGLLVFFGLASRKKKK